MAFFDDDDPKLLVARGYDAIAEVYFERYARSQVRDRWLKELIVLLPKGAQVWTSDVVRVSPLRANLPVVAFR